MAEVFTSVSWFESFFRYEMLFVLVVFTLVLTHHGVDIASMRMLSAPAEFVLLPFKLLDWAAPFGVLALLAAYVVANRLFGMMGLLLGEGTLWWGVAALFILLLA
jgi:hypothetical protein